MAIMHSGDSDSGAPPASGDGAVQLHAVDPLSPETYADPYPFYRALRDHAPLFPVMKAGYWLVSRYEDVRTAALNTADCSSNLMVILFSGPEGGTTMLDGSGNLSAGRPVDVLALTDPPDHERHRRVTQRVLSTAHYRSLEGAVRELAGERITPLLVRGHGDWMREVALRLPMTIALHLVGFPRADGDRVKAWCDHAVALLGGMNTEEELREHGRATMELYGYVRDRLRSGARGSPRGLSRTLLAAVENEELTFAEAASIAYQILIAGNDSSASAMGSAVRLLCERTDLQDLLRERPERIPDFVEEVLRLESPFQGHFRQVRREIELGGVTLSPGDRLMLLWASANRDERVFERPAEIDLDRANLRAHMAFGWGIHHCLGAPLARMEVRVVLEELLRRTRRVGLDGPSAYIPSAFARTLRTLPVRVS